MFIEQIIFIIIAFAIFVYMFFRMMRNSDISYVVVLIIEAIGIALNFLEVLFNIKLNIVFLILKYTLSIIIPILVIILEKQGKSLAETSKLILVKILIKSGNIKKAKKLLLELTSKYPDNYDAHKLLAEVYEKEGGMRKAIDEYVQALDVNKQDYDSYYRVAYLLTCLDRKQDASQMLFNLLEKKPEYQEATILLGNILIENEQYKEAERIYQDAIRLNPGSYELNYSLGIVYTMLNDFQNAKLYYEKATAINALSFTSKYSLAEIEMIYKNLDEAEKYFQEVVEDEELSADAYYELSKISLFRGEKDTAIKYANIAVEVGKKRIAEKIKKEQLFMPIIARIAMPFNLEEKEEKLTEREKKAKEHLEEMVNKTRDLSYDDIKMFKKYKKMSDKHKEEAQKEKHE